MSFICSGQINVMSSGEESDDDEDDPYVLPEERRKIRPPKETYAPDLQNINVSTLIPVFSISKFSSFYSLQANDISLTLSDTPLTKLGLKGKGIPKLVVNREVCS